MLVHLALHMRGSSWERGFLGVSSTLALLTITCRPVSAKSSRRLVPAVPVFQVFQVWLSLVNGVDFNTGLSLDRLSCRRLFWLLRVPVRRSVVA